MKLIDISTPSKLNDWNGALFYAAELFRKTFTYICTVNCLVKSYVYTWKHRVQVINNV